MQKQPSRGFMSIENDEQRKRRQFLDRVDREILRDLLSLAMVQVTVETGTKHTRSEALREVLMRYCEKKPDIRRQILSIDDRRNLKTV